MNHILNKIIQNKLRYDKIIPNIQVDHLNFSPGFADFIPEILNSNNELQNWYDNILIKSNIKNKFREQIINKNFYNELQELNIMKKNLELNAYYNSQLKFAKPFILKNSLEISQENIIKLDKILKEKEIVKMNQIEYLKSLDLGKDQLYNKLKPILKEIDQIKACIKLYNITENNNLDFNLQKKYNDKKFILLEKINKLNLYNGFESGIGFERLSLDILKEFAEKMGSEYYVGEILSNHIWKINEKKKKGMKQDLDGFIFSISNGFIRVHKIFEFKSSHLAIIEDIVKLEKLIDYLINNNFQIKFNKCKDGIYRPVNDNNSDNFILNRQSFDEKDFNIINRYRNINYIFRVENNKKLQFNYVTISQFNKTKKLNNLESKKNRLSKYIDKNKKSINVIKKISLNQGLIGIVIKNQLSDFEILK